MKRFVLQLLRRVNVPISPHEGLLFKASSALEAKRPHPPQPEAAGTSDITIDCVANWSVWIH